MRKENRTLKQILAKLLVFALVFQLAVPVEAAPVAEETAPEGEGEITFMTSGDETTYIPLMKRLFQVEI